MASVGGERVEFVGLRGDEPVVGDGTDHAGPSRGPRGTGWLLAGGAVLLLTAGSLARVASGPAPVVTSPARPTVSPLVAVGPVTLPPGFGAPRQLVAGPATSDVVWVLGAAGVLARVGSGVVTAVGRPSVGPVTAIAVDPDGRRLVAATSGPVPMLRILDPTTLDVRGQVALGAPAQAVAAGPRFVYAADPGGVHAFRTSTSPTSPTSAVPVAVRWAPLPAGLTSVAGLVETGDRGSAAGDGSDDVVPPGVQVTLVGADGAGARVLGVQLATGAVTVSATWPGPVSFVTSPAVLVAHDDGRGAVAVTPLVPADSAPGWAAPDVQPTGTTIWPTVGASFLTVVPHSNSVQCFDGRGVGTGRATVGDDGTAVAGPLVRAGSSLYAVTARGRLERGGPGTC